MKIITLNIWGGHVEELLLKFFSAHQDVDIFCLQEVYHEAPNKITDEERYLSLNILNKIIQQLPCHHFYFRPMVKGVYGLAMIVKKDLNVIGEGEVKIHQNPYYQGVGPTHCRSLQWLEFAYKKQNYTVINIHGLWNGKGKIDSPERLEQSRCAKLFMNSLSTPIILCGDFNLLPETESLSILEKGMNNLIKTYNIRSTRTSFYKKPERFADYILISCEIKVRNFTVLPDEVSDHAALLLDFI